VTDDGIGTMDSMRGLESVEVDEMGMDAARYGKVRGGFRRLSKATKNSIAWWSIWSG
jgi:hypothetical protein